MTGHAGGRQLDGALEQLLFRALADRVDAFVNVIDRERRILFLNRTLTRDISEILGKRIEDFVAPTQRETTIECVERAFRTSRPQGLDFTVTLASGELLHLSTRFFPFESLNGQALALQITTDVTERRRLTEELEQSMEFRRKVIENLPDFVALVDRGYRYVWVNRVAPGLTLADVIGKQLGDYIAPAELHKAQDAIDTIFDSGKTAHYELEAYGDGKANAWYAVRAVPVISEGKVENVLLLSSDITERKRAEHALRETEEQLHRAQRLESLGQLAGGIAHDFNNLLQVISGNLAFMKEDIENGGAPLEDLEQAMRATERAGELTSHLLAIGRRNRVVPQRANLGTLVERGVRMLRRAIPENVRLRYEPPRESYFVEVDAPQFEQVLINLCVNARDAMPQGGILTIAIHAERKSDVTMTVSDTGSGIAAENLRRIFEPFFTTKGAGSGLGLAVAAGIVAAHGGQIAVESSGRDGSTFSVRLPRVGPGSEQPGLVDDTALRGSGVILVAEDEELVRAQVQRILERAGYSVLQAENGARAVELFRQHRSEVDLVLMDVVMPELDGWQAYLQILEIEPGVKVLFTTGYAASVLPEGFAAGGARLLSKPYRPQRLLLDIRDLLAEAPPR